MPSETIVPVAPITNIKRHPNADSLDVAQVLGWQVVVGRDQYKEGDSVVYIAPDYVLTDKLAQHLGVKNYLHNGRVRAVRLRGEYSFGLCIPFQQLVEEDPGMFHDYNPGDEWNLAEYLEITKFVQPTRTRRGTNHAPSDRKPQNPLFFQYTHINNLRHYPDVFADGEILFVTEKIHGTNSRVGKIDGVWFAGSHKLEREPEDELYNSPIKIVQGLVEELSRYHNQVIVYGEIYGSDVQSLHYGEEGFNGYRVFDIMIDGKYVDFPTLRFLCGLWNVETVPVLCLLPYYLKGVAEYASGNTQLGLGAHIREGVVVRPVHERTHPRVGRVIFKYISDEYMVHKHSDFEEV